MELSGAQILLEYLKREGVEVVFGFPSGVDIYNELPNASFKHVLVRHEQGPSTQPAATPVHRARSASAW